MFGAFMDAAMSIPKMMHAEEMQDDAQAFSDEQGWRSREFSSAQAVAQRDWEEKMSNSQWQRTVKDLRAGGLNPILAATKGPGQYHGSAAASSGIASAGGSPANWSTNFTQAEINSSQAKLLKEQTRSEHENIYKRYWEASVEEQRLQTEKHKTEAAKHEAEILSNSAKGASLEGEIDTTTYGKIMRYIDRSIRSITGGSSAYRNSTR